MCFWDELTLDVCIYITVLLCFVLFFFTSYASASFANFSLASGSFGLVSGWYFFASWTNEKEKLAFKAKENCMFYSFYWNDTYKKSNKSMLRDLVVSLLDLLL